MKLFYSKGACSLVVRIILNELELNAEFESVDLKTKQTERGEDFFQINPKGAVPTLQLDNGKILTENAIILQYLANTAPKNTLLPPMEDFQRYEVLEWLNFITTELHKGFSPLFNPEIPQEVKDDIFIPILEKKFIYVNNKLHPDEYLSGKNFTLPDAYLFVMIRWALYFKINLEELTELKTYHARLNKRASIQQSLKQEK